MGPVLHDSDLDQIGCLGRWDMFPDANNVPSVFLERMVGITVSFHVAIELLRPPLGVGLWEGGVFGAPVPKAPVNEHGDLFS